MARDDPAPFANPPADDAFRAPDAKKAGADAKELAPDPAAQRGCLRGTGATFFTGAAITATIVLILVALASRDDKGPDSTCANQRRSARGFAAQIDPCAAAEVTTVTVTVTEELPTTVPAESATGATTSAAPVTASADLGGGMAGPPAADQLPPGARLVTGQSGDMVGPIAQDGASRFLSIEHPGVLTGNVSIAELAVPWTESGEVREFGVRISSATDNQGRYGFNLFRNGTTYSGGCSMEVGQESCRFFDNGRLEAGDSVVIIVGEQGHVEEKGDFTFEWWFVFQPDAA